MQGKKGKESGESVDILYWVVREGLTNVSLSRDLKGGN